MMLIYSSLVGSLLWGGVPTVEAETPVATAQRLLAAGREALANGLAASVARARGDPEDVDVIFALAALASSSPGENDAHATRLDEGRAWLRARRRADGSFLAPPVAVESAWYALLALGGSSRPDDQEAAGAAAQFLAVAVSRTSPALPQPARLATPVGAALDFLRSTGAARRPAGAELVRHDAEPAASLARFAGGSFDVRAARRLLWRDPLASLTRELGLPARGGPAQDVHLAARVLADLGSPRLVDERGRTRRWPEELVQALAAGAARPAAGEDAPLVETAARVLALSALAPWLVSLPDTALEEAARREPSTAAILPADCLDCHEALHPDIVHQWRQSRHAAAGAGCEACHGRNHSQIFRENGAVSPRACGACHARQVEEFAGSKHATAEARLLSSALFAATPEAARPSCRSCHAIGKTHADGATGSCAFCHSSHAASSAEAREPEACTGCHTGDDYPQELAYRLSRHGALYYRSRDARLAPTCVTCHQPGGDHGTSHGIAAGGAGSGGHPWPEEPAVPMEELTQARFAEQRAAMVRTCVPCHSSRFAEESLASADELKREGNRQLLEARRVILDLHADGLLGLEPGEAPPLLGPPARIDPSLPGGAVLRRFHDMWRFHYAWTWKGAYHASPSVSNLESRPGLDVDLLHIRAEAARLRQRK